MRVVVGAREQDPELSQNQAVERIGQHVGINPDGCAATGTARWR
jgi:hypothetical protein